MPRLLPVSFALLAAAFASAQAPDQFLVASGEFIIPNIWSAVDGVLQYGCGAGICALRRQATGEGMTAQFVGGQPTLNITGVSGGGQVFVRANGSVGYTENDSQPPKDATLKGFTWTSTSGDSGINFGELSFTGFGATGFVGCRTQPEGRHAFQVFANVEGEDWSACESFVAVTQD